MGTRIIASNDNWIESTAIEQLNKTSSLPDMLASVGMPDLHPGKDAPIGAVFATKNMIYPHLVGNDIGCGMSLWQTELKPNISPNKLVKKLNGLEGAWNGDQKQYLSNLGIASTDFDQSLGTIGSGNHFVEIQRLIEACDPLELELMKIEAKSIFILVHSGSRGLGETILREHTSRFANAALQDSSEEGISYLKAHAHAMNWARANRSLIAERFLSALGTKAKQILDICHNCVTPGKVDEVKCWLHRKGAAPSDVGPVMIPGSRGTASYLVVAKGEQRINLSSLAHGAGRKWKRSDCRERLEKRFSKENLLQTEVGSRVICDDKDLLYEEAPQAYKNIDIVVADLVNEGLIKVIGKFMPIVTYKTKAEVIR